MTAKNELPDDGGYLVMPRRIAIMAAIGMVISVGGPALSLYISDKAQDQRMADIEHRRIPELERRMSKLEDKSEADRALIAEMKGDIRVIRQILEKPRP